MFCKTKVGGVKRLKNHDLNVKIKFMRKSFLLVVDTYSHNQRTLPYMRSILVTPGVCSKEQLKLYLN